MKYVLKSKRGDYLAKKDSGFMLVTSLDKALKYDDTFKLTNIKDNCLPNTLKKFGPYKVVCVDSKIKESAHIKPLQAKKNGIPSKTDNIKEVKRKVLDLQNEFQNIKKKQSDLKQRLSRTDLIQEDLLHYIENHKFSAAEGYQLCKSIQAIRDERREIKNQLHLCELFTTDEYKLFLNGKLEKDLSVCDNHYKPRILNELFENNESRSREKLNVRMEDN